MTAFEHGIDLRPVPDPKLLLRVNVATSFKLFRQTIAKTTVAVSEFQKVMFEHILEDDDITHPVSLCLL